VRFAPLTQGLWGVEQRKGEEELWRRVEDFQWLQAEKPSPHWRVLEESERRKMWERVGELMEEAKEEEVKDFLAAYLPPKSDA